MLQVRGTWFVDPETGNVHGKPLGYVSKQGYVVIDGTWAGKGRTLQAHRLVWEAVHGPIPEGLQINHLNGIKADNRIANLELVTPKENARHAFATGLRHGLKGEAHPSAKLTEENVREIRALYRRSSQTHGSIALARRFGVCSRTIRNVVKGDTWSEVAA